MDTREQSHAAAASGEAVRRGRPLEADRDVAILHATLLLLTEVGYDRLSIESVATRAGVGRPTVYRRWADKAALVAAAVEHRAAGSPPDTWSGELRDDLITALQWLSGEIAEQEIGLLGATFAGMRGDPDLAAAMRRLLQRDQTALTEQPFRLAIKRGDQLAAGAAALFAEIAPAVIVHRLLVVGQPCDRKFLDHLFDDVLLPLIRRP